MKTTLNFLIIFTLILLSNIVYSQSVPSYVPTNGLVGWWGFNGNAQDGSGNGNHGTVNVATLTADRFGNQNSAYDFIVTNSRIQLPITGNINSASQLTFTGFFNLSNLSGGDILGNWTNSTASVPIGLILSVNQSRLYAAVNGGQDIFSNQSLLPNQWHHYSFVFDGNNPTPSSRIRMYLNGSLQSISHISTNTPIPSSIGNLSSSTYLGCRQIPGGLTSSFKGKLDDIGIWNRALTQQEITNLYNANSVGINENIQSNLFSVFPNPTQSLINVKVDTKLIGNNYSIYDNTGRVVFTGNLNAENTTIELGNLSGGIYLFSVGDIVKQNFKIIKSE